MGFETFKQSESPKLLNLFLNSHSFLQLQSAESIQHSLDSSERNLHLIFFLICDFTTDIISAVRDSLQL